MKVVLFCGGLGMRMRDGVTNAPKPMAMIGDRPLLWHVMRYYAHYGHTDFVLCLGYGASAVKDFFLNYDETRSNDFVLKGGGDVELFRTDIADWRITFVDTGLHSAIGERLRRVRRFVENEEMFLAQDYICLSCLIRVDAALAALPIADEFAGVAVYALLLQHLSSAMPRTIVHVPHIVCHRDRTRIHGSQELRRQAVAAHLRRIGSSAPTHPGEFDSVRICWPLPQNAPLVSIIVPTRDKVRLLRACLEGVLAATRYPHMEVLVVDNGSVKAATQRYFQEVRRDPRVRVLRYPAAYNYSAINNFAVRAARGSYICLLNNDTEILHEDWLCEMMRQAVRSHVGAVGAKLLYADRSIQHAGVIVGLGDAAGHAHRYLRNDKPGYFNHAHLPQYVSAVTAACLVVAKSKFLDVGGLDETNLAIAFNDVDLCLKLGAAGWRNIFTPHAVLIHHESKSRRRDRAASEQMRYRMELKTLQTRWGTVGFKDPCHHPNLSQTSETFQIAFTQANAP